MFTINFFDEQITMNFFIPQRIASSFLPTPELHQSIHLQHRHSCTCSKICTTTSIGKAPFVFNNFKTTHFYTTKPSRSTPATPILLPPCGGNTCADPTRLEYRIQNPYHRTCIRPLHCYGNYGMLEAFVDLMFPGGSPLCFSPAGPCSRSC